MRKSCINTDQLIRYAQGISDSKEMHKIEKHLLTCDLCMERLSGTVNSLHHDTNLHEYTPYPEKEAAQIVYQLNQNLYKKKHFFVKNIQNKIKAVTFKIKEYFHSFFINGPIQYNWMGLEPQLLTYRSQSAESLEYFYHKKKFNDILLKFYFEKTINNCFNMQLSIQSKKQYPMIRITLKQENGSRISQLVGNAGEWIKDLQFGTYSLSVEENAIQKGECLLNIHANTILFDKKK